MADIFISYKKEDAGRVVRIVEGLRKEGFTVWWDHGIAPGSSWDQAIQKELEAAKLVIAVWSELSVSAPWVKEEAAFGKQRGTLLPVRIDDVEPPLGFGLIQMADLSHWDGDIEDETWDHFIEAAKATIAGEPVHGLEKPVRRKNPLVKLLPIMALVVVVAGAGLYALAKLSSVSGVSVDYGDGTTSTYSRGGPAKPTEAEEQMFQKAVESRLKSDYLDYLRAYGQGFYAEQVRNDVLPFCAFEQHDVWKPNSVQQALRGVSHDTSIGSQDKKFASQKDACDAAKQSVEGLAERACRLIATNSQGRNGQHSLEWQDCDCSYLEAGETWMCSVDPTYSCSWEMKSFENVEVCG